MKLFFKKIVSKALIQGVSKATPDILPFVIQANINGLIYFTLDVVLSIIFFITLEDPYISYGLLVAGISFLVTSVGFNKMGWTTLSRLSTVSIGSFLVVYCALYLGPESFASSSLLLGAIFPFVYFNVKEKIQIAGCILVPVVCYAFLLIVDYKLGPQIQIQKKSTIIILQVLFFLVPFIGIVTNTLTAVTQREKKTEELAHSQQILKAIFSALFHDLANPAMMVFMISDAAKEAQSMTPKSIDRLHRVTDQMKRVLNKLRKMTMLSGGKNQLQYEPINLRELMEEVVEFALPQASTKGVHILIENFDDEYWVKVDKEVFMFQVVMNFLSNAIKFTDAGKTIRIKTRRSHFGVGLDIQDQGVGMDAQCVASLLSSKNQMSTSGTNGEKGTGLGFLLAQKFLEFMGGHISIKSFPIQDHPTNHGTTVTIELPLAAKPEIILASELNNLREIS